MKRGYIARELEDKQRWDLEEKMFEFEEDFRRKNKIGLERLIAQQLFPGIPDEVTLAVITTKLSWRDVHALRSVSRGWYSAIQDRLVYVTRVHCHLTETLVLLGYSNGSLALRCLGDNSYFELPNISPDHGGMSPYHQFVAMDGKVYVFGGVFNAPTNKVYMLDLAAGQRSWTEVASMHIARSNFACNVMGGKIYVCGGTWFNQSLSQSEVYDPKGNVWSSIKPMCSSASFGKSKPVGEELFVYDAMDTDVMELYHPVKDEWRKVEPFDKHLGGTIFVSGGRVYSLNWLGIWVYSFEGNSWTHVRSHSTFPVGFMTYSVLAVEDHLLAFGCLYIKGVFSRTAILRSIGFDLEKKKLETVKEKLEWREERGWGTDCPIYCSYPVHL